MALNIRNVVLDYFVNRKPKAEKFKQSKLELVFFFLFRITIKIFHTLFYNIIITTPDLS